MTDSSFYINKINDIQDDVGLIIMKALRERKLERGLEVNTSRGVFKISNAKDKNSNRMVLKIELVGKDVVFNQYTINPIVLIDILERVQELV